MRANDFNQPLEATGVSARDWPWSFRFAPFVLAGASTDRSTQHRCA